MRHSIPPPNRALTAMLFSLVFTAWIYAAVPQIISYQGRVAVGSVNFDGTGLFKFALVNGTGTVTYWSNDGTSVSGAAPSAAVSLPVSKGLYSVLLGDAGVTNMTPIPASVFTNEDVRLRVWFDDGVNGSQLLAPDQRIAAVGYAMMADSVTDGAITSSKIADGAVNADKLAPGAVESALTSAGLSGVAPGGIVLSNGPNPELTTAGYMNLGTTSVNTNAPAGRKGHFGFWSGSEMIIWGGSAGAHLGSGGRYSISGNWLSIENSPVLLRNTCAFLTPFGLLTWGTHDSDQSSTQTIQTYDLIAGEWSTTSTIGAPNSRWEYAAVWTGNEMIVWGGYRYDGSGYVYLSSGARYNPSTSTWTPMSAIGAPSPRSQLTATWTGSEMIVFGGYQGGGVYLATGARYNPSTDTWSPITTSNAPSPRASHSAVWTGSKLIIWGGGAPSVNSGAMYNPATNTWETVPDNNAPVPRGNHSAIWTGSEMIIWGGSTTANSGGRFNPNTGLWTATAMNGAPSARYYHTAVWTGANMIIWGGIPRSDQSKFEQSGAAYSPAADSWTAIAPTKLLYLYQKQ